LSSTLLPFPSRSSHPSPARADLFFVVSFPPSAPSNPQEKTKKILDIWTKGLTFPPQVLKRLTARTAAAIADADASAPPSAVDTAPIRSSSTPATNGRDETSERRESSEQSKKSKFPPNSGTYRSLGFFSLPHPLVVDVRINFETNTCCLAGNIRSSSCPLDRAGLRRTPSLPSLPFPFLLLLLEQVADLTSLAGRITMPFPFSSFLLTPPGKSKETDQQ